MSLPLFGEPQGTASASCAIAAKGFRPFFLLAGLFGVLSLVVWVFAIWGGAAPAGYLDPTYWHAHEMVFGFAVAVIAGFLLTAVSNWTQRETLTGYPLLALAALWIAGRVGLLAAPLLPRLASALLDLAFLPALIVVLARPLLATNNRRNFVMLAILFTLFLANLVMHLDVLGVWPGLRARGVLVGVDVVVLVILIISGRVFPMFTRNATGIRSIASHPVLDAIAIGSMALLTVLDAVLSESRLTSVVAGWAGAFAALRTIHWGARYSFRAPLLWILHVGYLWIPTGLLLRASSLFVPTISRSLATHALTAGAISALCLGMMSRVALGHTGRLLSVSPATVASFVLVTVGALIRVAGPLVFPDRTLAVFGASGCMWVAAFSLFLFVYAPLLLSPRADGKPG
jgi:uncharacterized protein involved in response to NO